MLQSNITQWGIRAALALAAWMPGQAWAQEPMALPQYSEQVRAQNPGLLAAQAEISGLKKKLGERGLLTSPYAFAEAQMSRDKSLSTQPLLYGNSRGLDQVDAGLEQRTGFGLSWRLAHQTSRTSVEGADPGYMPVSEYYAAKTGLELAQDLWRNAFGAEVVATADAMEAETQAKLLEREYQVRQVLVQAEDSYWKLALARENIRIQQELLDRAQRLADWVAERVRLKLQDSSDWMQAQAQVQMRRLSLSQAQDQERGASRAFNLLRGTNSPMAAETLPLAGEAELAIPSLPEAVPSRKDVQTLEWQHKAMIGESMRQQHNVRPELQAKAALYFNGLDAKISPAWSDSWDSRYPAYSVGLGLRMPLDYFARESIQTGYAEAVEAVQKMLDQKRLEAETEWQELKRQLAENQSRLKIARELETLQKQKADYERGRLKRGNSVTFQVLQFEQEWGESQLARLNVESAILELLAKIKLYGE